jgi:spore maturation protein SpmB
MNFLAGLTKGLNVAQSFLPFVNSTVTSVESLLGGAPGSVKKAAALQIIGSGLSVAAAATGAPAETVSMALNAVNPLIDCVVALKNVFGEFSKSSPAAVQAQAAGQS